MPLRHNHIPRVRMMIPHFTRIQGAPPCSVVDRDDGTRRIAILQGGSSRAALKPRFCDGTFASQSRRGLAKPFASVFPQLPSIMAASANKLPNDFRHLLSATFRITVTIRPFRRASANLLRPALWPDGERGPGGAGEAGRLAVEGDGGEAGERTGQR
jgi:hypothetical protein